MKKIVTAILCLLLLCSCTVSRPQTYKSHDFFCMDSFAQIRIYDGGKDTDKIMLEAEACARKIEAAISKTSVGSDAYSLNSHGYTELKEDGYLLELIDISAEISQKTGMYFSHLGGKIKDAWTDSESSGILPDKNVLELMTKSLKSTKIINEAGKLVKHGDAELDFGAVGKGYTADKLVQELKENGVKTAMVSFISSIAVFGDRDFKIKIRMPDLSGNTAGYLTMRDEALSVSGDYERFFTVNGERYNHIIDPHTGMPSDTGIHSVAVICKSAAMADALSTAIFAMGVDNAEELYRSGTLEFEMIIITDDGFFISKGIEQSFVPEAKYSVNIIG